MTDCNCPRMSGALLPQPHCPVHGSKAAGAVTAVVWAYNGGVGRTGG